MASGVLNVLLALLFLTSAATTLSASLRYDYYKKVCPAALPTIKRVIEAAVQNERRTGGSILRLHFHDCFVNGCDASILLDESTPNSERNARPNLRSARGFKVIDQIKEEVDKACGRSVVSCADILAVAARDSVVALGGPWWQVPLGRRDSTRAYLDIANRDIPAPSMDLPQLINTFNKQGLNVKDLVALSGGHTLGFAQCFTFRDRIYNESNIDPKFTDKLRKICPPAAGNGDTNLAGLDSTSARFDTSYFANLLSHKGLLHSDQALFGGVSTDQLVKNYKYNPKLFWAEFAKSMVKMGNIKPLTGKEGVIRSKCSKLN
ncbi:peroxidase 2-like [Punica granatum]|uniref:Peroxidase n=2 Tax=Punica granatum TaxID=22663 RepID=A0A218XA37_PUNGR|nr:peroxidase 2-like [Punica granatum]OWM81648.1 hypothetical protein CDL15_Pgr007686 [Punica granatum]PKI62917.1 hypothetical protein CRG98_016676 [Punica granatum]